MIDCTHLIVCGGEMLCASTRMQVAGRRVHPRLCEKCVQRNAPAATIEIDCDNLPPAKELFQRRGPGHELRKLIEELGVKKKPGCTCGKLARRMNDLGVSGCREHREELLTELRKNYAHYDWTDKLKAAWHAVTSGLALELDDWSDPIASLFDLAIRRAESLPPS